MTDRQNLETLFAQADGHIDQLTGGVTPSIQLSSTFLRDENNELTSADHSYARDQNDLFRLAERIISKAEGAAEARLFPSGMAAVAALARAVNPGCTLVIQSGIYWGATAFIREHCARSNINLIEVDCADIEMLSATIDQHGADLIWVETPSNPYLKTVDLAACSKIARDVGAALVVDSTAATPVHSNPIAHGADFVIHSATKSINGHSDVLAGFVIAAKDDHPYWNYVKSERHMAGAILGAIEAYLLIRGMRTLPLRVERMSQTALAVARFLHAHPKVETVLYPGLQSDPGHQLATRQMKGGFGSLLSFRVLGGKNAALSTIGKLRLFKRATSLGGVESLVEHRHTIEATVPDDLLRLSVGIEHCDDLIADLDHALGE